VRQFGAPKVSINRRDYREKGFRRSIFGCGGAQSRRLHHLLSQLGPKDATNRHAFTLDDVATDSFGIGYPDPQA